MDARQNIRTAPMEVIRRAHSSGRGAMIVSRCAFALCSNSFQFRPVGSRTSLALSYWRAILYALVMLFQGTRTICLYGTACSNAVTTRKHWHRLARGNRALTYERQSNGLLSKSGFCTSAWPVSDKNLRSLSSYCLQHTHPENFHWSIMR